MARQPRVPFLQLQIDYVAVRSRPIDARYGRLPDPAWAVGPLSVFKNSGRSARNSCSVCGRQTCFGDDVQDPPAGECAGTAACCPWTRKKRADRETH